MTEPRDDSLPEPDYEVMQSGPRTERVNRNRVALVAGATTTAAIVVGTVIAVVSATGGSVATPGRTGATTAAPLSTPARRPGAPGIVIPAGWQARSFQGLTFAVPPGARKADEIDGRPPTFTWNGPGLGHATTYASVMVTVRGTHGDVPQDADRRVTVPGAVAVRTGIGPASVTDGDPGDSVEVTSGGFQLFTAHSIVIVGVQFASGPEGERMARELLASFDLTGLATPPAAPS